MRQVFLFLVAIFLGANAIWAEDAGRAKQRPKRSEGIRWCDDLDEGFAVARREGRPILLAVNAREDERANIELATGQYRSKAWGEATRDYVCFVANPNDHKGSDGKCARYAGIKCSVHKAALKYVAKRFGADLITPQHILLEPDQTLAYRKEYYERVVGPRLFERWLSHLAPAIAFSRAGIARESAYEALVAKPAQARGAAATAWLGGPDGLSAAGIANALDELVAPDERLALIDALAQTPTLQAPVVEYMAEERLAWPDEDTRETQAWVRALLQVHRPTGVRAAARVICKTEQDGLRAAIVSAWTGKDAPDPPSLPDDEKLLLWEARALAGAANAGAIGPVPDDPVWRARVRRARRRAGKTTGQVAPNLSEALASDDMPQLRRALLAASVDTVKAHRKQIMRVLNEMRWLGVRAAAAMALARAGLQTPDRVVSRTLGATVFDTIEGPDLRPLVAAWLGEDPGANVQEWARQINARLGGTK